MKERITAAHPALPEPVMDKLLTMPAGDLDLILQHPKATTWKVQVSLVRQLRNVSTGSVSVVLVAESFGMLRLKNNHSTCAPRKESGSNCMVCSASHGLLYSI